MKKITLLLLIIISFVGCKEKPKPNTIQTLSETGMLDYGYKSADSVISDKFGVQKRYFIVFYYSKNNRLDFIGNMGSTTTMGDMFNPEEFIRDVDISNKKYGVLQTSITGIMEVSKQDFEAYWKNR